jgi:O-acetyl-ADP-ribose deacetylase (regulator of RNase III)
VQVCPRRCRYETARRDLITRAALSGRVIVRVAYSFETTNCSVCGSPFIATCSRCEKPVLAPVVDRCEFCGLPHPWAIERRAAATRSQPRQWLPESATSAAATLIKDIPDSGRLFAIDGDVTTFAVDAVVSNDDVEGRMWAAVSSSIKTVAGYDVERDSVGRGPYQLGSAWFTYAGNLPIKGIIHVAAMDRRGKNNGLETIEQCVGSALKEARKRGMRSLALPAVGTGPNAISLEAWLRQISRVVVTHLRKNLGPSLDVLFVLYEPEDFPSLAATLTKAVDGP